MLKKLIHPEHGTHFCYTEWELEDCLKNGWKAAEDENLKVSEDKPKKRGRQKKVKDGYHNNNND